MSFHLLDISRNLDNKNKQIEGNLQVTVITSPILKQRPVCNEALAEARSLNLNPVLSLVAAARATKHDVSVKSIIECPITTLDAPWSLPDVDVSAARIAKAIDSGEIIGIETDHDVDGVTSHAVLYRALVDYFGHPADKVRSYIGHRLKEGYGLSQALVERIMADESRPSLIITADNGSSDGPRIEALLEAGIETVVTDHHGLPAEGPPEKAVGCVSPAREDSEYPDPLIAGVMVAFLLMCAVRRKLVDGRGGEAQAGIPKMTGLLDYVALGTIADCVSLARSSNNRAVVRTGLALLNGGNRACWRAAKFAIRDAEYRSLTSTDLAFWFGPRINASGRMDDAMVGVRYLLSETDQEAAHWLSMLEQENLLRREVEADLKEQAIAHCEGLVEKGRTAVQVYLPNGHAGVHGIVASRLVERYGRPAVCFSPKVGEPGVITGSARGVEGMHIREAFQKVEDLQPGLLLKFGGHEYAGGLTILEKDFKKFEALFEGVAATMLDGVDQSPVLLVDGDMDTSYLTLELIDQLSTIEPFGREFEAPVFTADLMVASVRSMGADNIHWRFDLVDSGGRVFQGVWFNAGTEPPMNYQQWYTVAFEAQVNWWKGNGKLQLIIRACEQKSQ